MSLLSPPPRWRRRRERRHRAADGGDGVQHQGHGAGWEQQHRDGLHGDGGPHVHGDAVGGRGDDGQFHGGVLASTSVTISNTGLFTITATKTASTETGTSNAFTVSAGAVHEAAAPGAGETAAPGTASGKTGTPDYHLAGTPFTVTVNAVDTNWNVVSSTDTVGITSNDGARDAAGECGARGGDQDVQRDAEYGVAGRDGDGDRHHERGEDGEHEPRRSRSYAPDRPSRRAASSRPRGPSRWIRSSRTGWGRRRRP